MILISESDVSIYSYASDTYMIQIRILFMFQIRVMIRYMTLILIT